MNRRGLLASLFALPFAPAALKASATVFLPSRLHYDDVAVPLDFASVGLWPWPEHVNCRCVITTCYGDTTPLEDVIESPLTGA